MEKKTIGRFIAVLRKANGMTQKELGDKLYVSDKTVSRWERDECTPELSLIPVIADIFGITTDELLRGERNSQNHAITEQMAENRREKSEKQLRYLLREREKRFGNKCIISVGIALLTGLLFFIGSGFGIAGLLIAFIWYVGNIVFQIISIRITWLAPETEEEYPKAMVDVFRTQITTKAVGLVFVDVTVIFSILLNEQWEWLFIGAVILLALYVVYTLVIQKVLMKAGLLVYSHESQVRLEYNGRLLGKTVVVAGGIAMLLGGVVFWTQYVGAEFFAEGVSFDNCEDFQGYMRQLVGDDYYYQYYTEEVLTDNEGNEMCTYLMPRTYYYVHAGNDSGFPISVHTEGQMDEAWEIIRFIHMVLVILLIVDVVLATGFYLWRRKRAGQ